MIPLVYYHEAVWWQRASSASGSHVAVAAPENRARTAGRTGHTAAPGLQPPGYYCPLLLLRSQRA